MFATRDRAAVRRCLFGVDLIAPRIVLTPSSILFECIGAGLEDGGGWWPIRTCEVFSVLHTPQGSPVIDALAGFDPGVQIVFAGFCGALGDLPIGTIVEAATARLSRSSHNRTSVTPMQYPPVKVSTVGSMAEGTTRSRLLSQAADVVDMEVGHVFEAAAICGHDARAWLIVSDRPGERPFFETTSTELGDAPEMLARDLRGLPGWAWTSEES